MNLASAGLWDTPIAKQIARDISSISGLYCGPAAIVWIAAVWNHHHELRYDYKARLKDKKLFPDGPRPFHHNLPWFQQNLNDLLEQETASGLRLSRATRFKYQTIHNEIATYGMPVIVRMLAPKAIDGLHYVAAYKSEIKDNIGNGALIQFHWQDNGLYGSNSDNFGLSKSGWRNVESNFFWWGACRVVVGLV